MGLRHRQAVKRSTLQELRELLHDSAGGIALSGDSGSGKSNVLSLMFDTLVRQGIGVTLIDPHGDLAADVERTVAALPRRFREHCLIIRPSDLSRVVSINPLSVPVCGNSLRWRAQVVSKVGHVARTLLYAWGESDFNSKPVLFKWLNRVLTTLATNGLTIPDGRHFFQVSGDIYRALTDAAPDTLAQVEMLELADMRPRDREEMIASAKNRYLGFLQNPAVELVLGRPTTWVDARTLIRERYITIISLESAGVLRDEDVEILANLWLTELLYAAYNLDRTERTPHVVFLDELPVFSSSFSVLSRALAQVRKYLLRFITAFQGTNPFPERRDDRLLHALMSQCRTTVVFRHRNPVDAKFFAELTTLPTLDPMKEKLRLTQLQQLQDGHDLVYLTDESDSWSDAVQAGTAQAEGTTSSSGESRSDSTSTTDSEATTMRDGVLRDAVTRAKNTQRGESVAHSSNAGRSSSQTSSHSQTATRGGSRTRRSSLVPRIVTREVTTSVQFLSTEEQVTLGARDISRQPVGEALVYTAGHPAMRVQFPLARQPFERTPKFGTAQVTMLRDDTAETAGAVSPDHVLNERLEFERRLVEHLDARSGGAVPPQLALPSDDSDLTI